MKNKKFSTIFTILFFIWFFGSMVLMWYFSETKKEMLMLAIAGQYFIMFGVIGIITDAKEKPLHPHIWIFPYIGFDLITVAILLHYHISIRSVNPETISLILFINIFTLTGILTFIKLLFDKKLLKACTFSIKGKCVALKRQSKLVRKPEGRTRIAKTYCPIYEILYHGISYQICNNNYANFLNPKVGRYERLKINPDNPNSRIFITKRMRIIFGLTLLIGIICFISGVILTITCIKSGNNIF